MRWTSVWLVALGLGLSLSACGRRESYTEKEVMEEIARRQGQIQTDIETTVKTAPPPMEFENPPSSGSGGSRTMSGSTRAMEPSSTPPPPAPSGSTPPASPMPSQGVGDVQLDPTTGQYGIAPPGAPEGYTIPLDNR